VFPGGNHGLVLIRKDILLASSERRNWRGGRSAVLGKRISLEKNMATIVRKGVPGVVHSAKRDKASALAKGGGSRRWKRTYLAVRGARNFGLYEGKEEGGGGRGRGNLLKREWARRGHQRISCPKEGGWLEARPAEKRFTQADQLSAGKKKARKKKKGNRRLRVVGKGKGRDDSEVRVRSGQNDPAYLPTGEGERLTILKGGGKVAPCGEGPHRGKK